MINNRQAGRRRGRNNNNPRQNGGGGNRGNGDSGNRIDNRARGNATQLLEKYRNMARDAQLAGDRVNMEYYLQFADHYFRVLADNRARQEENSGGQGQGQQQRFRRFEEGDDTDEFGDDNDGFGDPMDDFRREEPRRDETRGQEVRSDGNRNDGNRGDGNRNDGNRRDEGRRDEPRREEGRREEAPREQGFREQGARENGRDQNPRDQAPRDPNRRDNRPPRRERAPVSQEVETAPQADYHPPVSPPSITEAANDVADAPAAEDVRPRRGRKPRREAGAPEAEPGLDMSVLPPAIGRVPDVEGEAAPEPAPRRPRRPRSAPVQAAE
ncbi:hypothetical protein BH10PSE13_BH10PSE13_25290 [soil metagenome]